MRTLILGLILVVAGHSHTTLGQVKMNDSVYMPESYPNLLDIRPVKGNGGYIMSDLGAWHGYGLNEAGDMKQAGSFRGPTVMIGRKGIRLLGKSLERFTLADSSRQPIAYYKLIESTYFPGRLHQKLTAGPFEIEMQLIMVSDRVAMTSYTVINPSSSIQSFTPCWQGKVTAAHTRNKVSGNRFVVTLKEAGQHAYALQFPDKTDLTPTFNGYRAVGSAIELACGQKKSFAVFASFCPMGTTNDAITAVGRFSTANPAACLADGRARWNRYLAALLERKTPYLSDPRFRNWAVKAVMTLMTNWRSPAGDLKHAGIYPAIGRFDAFWAWDSWEHAVGVALFNPELAKNQIRAVFDYQTPEGMIVDMLCLDKSINNIFSSKPPLAGWSVYMVYQRTKDLDFVREMYPRLKQYHRWWYNNRDNNHNGLCEYGGTKPKILYGQWESGMDVAVKFAGAKMVKIREDAYSFDQESVELNSYLYAEKRYLASLAEMIGLPEEAGQFRREAVALRQVISDKMFDRKTGYFYDIKSKTGKPVEIIDVSGWIPLFTGVATPEQAEQVKKVMLDPELFGTFFPFSSLNHKHPKYNPKKGYFRGQTWLNYTYFGIRGFKNYGFTKEADHFTRLLPDRLEGIADPGYPIRENYSSATGKGLCAIHFSWSAVFSLLLLTEDADTFPYIP